MTHYLQYLYRIIALLFIFLVLPATIYAGESDRFKGWAWSSNIGWISFNCTNTNSCGTVDYGVTIALNNSTISGHAWSSNVGWIDFSGTTFNPTTGVISGTANVLTGSLESDGWDGDIELFDASPIAYGLDVEVDSEVAGYAWGDDVVGWVSFNCENDSSCGTVDYQVTVEPFFFDFTADSGLTPANKVAYDGNVTLNWTTNGAVSCTASGAPATGWASPPGKVAGEPSPGSDTIFNLQTDTTFTLTCQDSSNRTITRDLLIYVAPPAPSLTLYVDDANIPFNTSTTLRWDALFVSSCTASGAWSGAKGVGSGNSESTGNLTALENYFTLTCDSQDPITYPDPILEQVLVNVERLTLDFALDSENVPFADPTELNWTATFASGDQCTASADILSAGSWTPTFSTSWTSTPTKDAVTDIAYSETVYKVGTTDPLDTGSYRFLLTCSGNAGQADIVGEAILKVGRNPNFSEEIGTNPDN